MWLVSLLPDAFDFLLVLSKGKSHAKRGENRPLIPLFCIETLSPGPSVEKDIDKYNLMCFDT